MEELQISGKRFISSRRVAKENGYHTDYIGQLIRGGKIKGQKVGRTWYVDAASFDLYLGSEAPAASVVTEEISAPEAVIEKTDATQEGSEEISATQDLAAAEEESTQRNIEALPTIIVEEPKIDKVLLESKAKEDGLQAAEEVAEEVAVKSERSVEETKEELAVESEPVEEAVPVTIRVGESEKKENKYKVQEVEIPAVVAIRKISQSKKGKGLRYMDEDESLVPEIAKDNNESRVTKSAQKEEVQPEAIITEDVEDIKTQSHRSGILVAGVVFAGVAVFVASAAFSSALSQTIQIEGKNPASVGYSLTW